MNDFNPRAVFGGNRPPLPEAYADLADDARKLVGRSLPFAVSDESDAELVAAIGKDCQSWKAKAERARKDEKDYYLEGGRKVDAFFKDLAAPIDRLVNECKQLVGDYQDAKRLAEQKRRDEEAAAARAEAERIAAEAMRAGNVEEAVQAEERASEAEAAAQAKPAELARVQNATGKVVAQSRTTWGFQITDEAAIPREYLMVNEAKIKAVVAAMKGATNIPGIKAVERHSTVF